MFDKFKTFVALAKYKSFTLTAQQMYCSQPTISQHIKVLETYYNVQLIERRNGEVILTPKGQQFFQYVQEILALHEQLKEKMNTIQDDEKNISVYVSHYLANNFFDELFSSVATENNCPCKVQSLDYAGLKTSLLEEKTNFAIMPYYAEDQEINERFNINILFEEEFVLIVPNNHLLASRKVVYTKDLKGENIFLPMCSFLQQRIRAAIEQKNVYPKFSHMSDFTLIQKAVDLNMGIGFVPRDAILPNNQSFTVKTVKGLQIKRQNAFIVNRFKGLKRAEQDYLKHVKWNIERVKGATI